MSTKILFIVACGALVSRVAPVTITTALLLAARMRST